MSRSKALVAGLLAGLLAGIVMTTAMLLLAWLFGVATPLAIIGDRLSVFIPPGPFLSIMGKVGGYNHLKQLGVGSTMAGQLFVGALAGALYGLCMQRGRRSLATRPPPDQPQAGQQRNMQAPGIRDSRMSSAPAAVTMSVFVVLPIIAVTIALWPVLGTSYRGF